MFNPSSISKAIAGGLVAVIAAEAARYSFQPSAETTSALAVIVTGVVSYLVGHLVVFFSPANRP